ncbi:MAG: addiction module protein [Kiritimatiellae bacterium]|nr:addiction module protein [Kiritimatiellia bacterium]
MSTVADKVFDEVFDLPADERIGLVDRLLASLNLPAQPDIDRLWMEEAERRVSEIEGGAVALVPGGDVFDKIRRKYA